MSNLAQKIACFCHSTADRLLDVGLRAFETTGSMTVWDLVVIRGAYYLLVLGNLFDRAGAAG